MARLSLLIARFRNKFWALPALGIACAVAGGLLIPLLDEQFELPQAVTFTNDPDSARAALQLIATMAVSMAGISFSVIVVALVLSAQQLSPRILQAFQRHPLNQAVLAVFLGTAAFALYVLSAVSGRRGDPIPELSIAVAMLLSIASLVLFVVFLHHSVRSLNASAIIRRIAADGHRAVDAWYPGDAGHEPVDPDAAQTQVYELRSRFEPADACAPRAGYVASVQAETVIRLAEAADAFVEQLVPIGEFVITGAAMARVWARDDVRDELIDEVGSAFILNEERVVDDDLAFPVRQLADVALKGLSPSINDPTTAENAMDSIADTLVRMARQKDPCDLRTSAEGTVRWKAAKVTLADLVCLGFDQVRRDGAGRASFAIRLLQLLSDIRENGGANARRCDEIDRQARLVRDQAVDSVKVREDAEAVARAYDELHGRAAFRSVAP